MKLLLNTFSICVFLHVTVFSALSLAADNESARTLESIACTRLSEESQKILDDESETTKYLSPYIADDIYQSLLIDSIKLFESEGGKVSASPFLASLPCQDIVSGFLMAIKKRMEYDRIDYFFTHNRPFVYGLLGLFILLGMGVYRFKRQQSVLVKR